MGPILREEEGMQHYKWRKGGDKEAKICTKRFKTFGPQMTAQIPFHYL